MSTNQECQEQHVTQLLSPHMDKAVRVMGESARDYVSSRVSGG